LLVLVTEVERVLLLPCWTLPKLRPEEATICCPEAALAHKTTLRRSRCHQTRLPSKPQRRISPTLSPCSNSARRGIVEPLPPRCRSPSVPAVSHCAVQRCHCFPIRRKSIDHGRLEEVLSKFRGCHCPTEHARLSPIPQRGLYFFSELDGRRSSSRLNLSVRRIRLKDAALLDFVRRVGTLVDCSTKKRCETHRPVF
jgi:hypothetical protein